MSVGVVRVPEAPETPAVDAIRATFAGFDRYLNGPSDRPVGVAVSGGGDSVALLQALQQWSQRPLEVFCVDHGLNPYSAKWTQSVADQAQRLGAGFTALSWTSDKPKTGVSAAARQARHRLLADAARAKGVSVLCLAHTFDDIAEAQIMRASGSTVGAPTMWSPSPVWPQGRGVFLYRPFLNLRRETLRDYLRERGVTWIDDPANDNLTSLRARVRQDLKRAALAQDADGPLQDDAPRLTRDDLQALLHAPETLGHLGMIVFHAEVFHGLPETVSQQMLANAVVCAGGGDKLPKRASLTAIMAGLASGQVFTLCGARVSQDQGQIAIVREAGDIRRHATGHLRLEPGIEALWDGRFALNSTRQCEIAPVSGQAAQLDAADQAVLTCLPVSLRTVLPVMMCDGRRKLLVNLDGEDPGLRLTNWVLRRFLAASGWVGCENDLLTRLGTAFAATSGIQVAGVLARRL